MLEPSWTMLKDQMELAAYVAVFFYCLWRGAGPERLLAGVLCAMLVADPIHRQLAGTIVWLQADVGLVVIDIGVMACVFFVALHANRVYPLWIAGAQIIVISGHLYRLSLEGINKFAYDAMTVTPSYIQFVAMTLGIAYHTSRHRRLGNYPSWRRSSFLTRGRAARTSPDS